MVLSWQHCIGDSCGDHCDGQCPSHGNGDDADEDADGKKKKWCSVHKKGRMSCKRYPHPRVCSVLFHRDEDDEMDDDEDEQEGDEDDDDDQDNECIQ